jgi:hypothetical protein
LYLSSAFHVLLSPASTQNVAIVAGADPGHQRIKLISAMICKRASGSAG